MLLSDEAEEVVRRKARKEATIAMGLGASNVPKSMSEGREPRISVTEGRETRPKNEVDFLAEPRPGTHAKDFEVLISVS